MQKDNQKEQSQKPADDFQKQIAQKDAVISDYTNHLKRLQAEFENFMKRAEKERSEMIAYSNEKLISKLLVVLDNFEHAIEHLKKIASTDIVNGVEMVSKEFTKILEGEGLKKICAKGCKFDPYLHEVVTCIAKGDCPEDTVVEEVQTGYTIGKKTIRCSKVIISKMPKQNTKENKTQSQKQED